ENISLSYLIVQLLASPRYESHPATVSVVHDAEHIANSLSINPSSGKRVLEWAANVCARECQEEVRRLTQAGHGLHFNAKNAKITPLENFQLDDLGKKMQEVTPTVWKLLLSLLQSD
ncbi:hypothetical protein SCHPADRAFT_805973, partial [Schizopora paradoxa]